MAESRYKHKLQSYKVHEAINNLTKEYIYLKLDDHKAEYCRINNDKAIIVNHTIENSVKTYSIISYISSIGIRIISEIYDKATLTTKEDFDIQLKNAKKEMKI